MWDTIVDREVLLKLVLQSMPLLFSWENVVKVFNAHIHFSTIMNNYEHLNASAQKSVIILSPLLLTSVWALRFLCPLFSVGKPVPTHQTLHPSRLLLSKFSPPGFSLLKLRCPTNTSLSEAPPGCSFLLFSTFVCCSWHLDMCLWQYSFHVVAVMTWKMMNPLRAPTDSENGEGEAENSWASFPSPVQSL